MDRMAAKENIYTKLCEMHGAIIDMIFKSLGLSFNPIDERTINEVWGTETRRMIQIEIISARLLDDELHRRQQQRSR